VDVRASRGYCGSERPPRSNAGPRFFSGLADSLVRLFRNNGLPVPEPEFPIRIAGGLIHVDLAYPLLKIAIECDGYAWHMDRASFERDRARDAELMALGWKVLRFTWAQITYRSEWVLQQVRGRLAS
jgi:hypothetical protein